MRGSPLSFEQHARDSCRATAAEMNHASDAAAVRELVRRAQTGSAEAFEALVTRYESPLYNFLLRRAASAEDAEEIAQDAFVRAWRKIASYDARWSFSTWLFTLARRLAATRERSRRPRRFANDSHDALDGVPVHADPGSALSASEESASLWSIADRVLDGDQRAALWLRYAEDLSVKEIAEVLGRSAVSVRVMLFRARARLAQHLEPSREHERARTSGVEASRLRKVGT
jgi:RNA polymerase sigma-70 factor (ECF subfamily)